MQQRMSLRDRKRGKQEHTSSPTTDKKMVAQMVASKKKKKKKNTSLWIWLSIGVSIVGWLSHYAFQKF